MIDYYKNKFYEGKVPYMRKTIIPIEKIFQMPFWSLDWAIQNKDFSYYTEPLKQYIKRKNRWKDVVKTEEFDKVILVSDDKNRIRKTAMILADGRAFYPNDIPERNQCIDGREIINGLAEIELDKETLDEKKGMNSYLAKVSECASCLLRATTLNALGILYTGFLSGALEEQCVAVWEQEYFNTYIGIPEPLLNHPQIQKLILEMGYDVIRLPDMDTRYYRKVANEIEASGAVTFADEEEKRIVIDAITRRCGADITEEEISRAFSLAMSRIGDRKSIFGIEHFKEFLNIDSSKPLQILEHKIGLGSLRKAVTGIIAVQKELVRNKKASLSCRHMIFEGNPGTGKTMAADLLSKILAAEGVTNGTVTVASRKDIIGKYIGHTAPKIAKLFADTRRGILFIDEAGFFLEDSVYGFTGEAIKEFVRYMELYRDVTVIFAFYPGEAKKFLRLDDGMRSRISEVIHFEDYSNDELFDIYSEMLDEKGYSIREDAKEKVRIYLQDQRRRLANQFGNARECRKFCDATVKAIAMRNLDYQGDEDGMDIVTPCDIDKAIGIAGNKEDGGRQICYGFNTGFVAERAFVL